MLFLLLLLLQLIDFIVIAKIRKNIDIEIINMLYG